MNKTISYILVFLFQTIIYSEQVLIITSAYNRPDFIEAQHKTFKKFLQDDYEFVVFNDAKVPSLQQAIEEKCANLEIKCINIPQNIHDQPYLERGPGEGFHEPAVRNANVVQYALNSIGYSHKGIVAIIDSDMFLVRPFSIKSFLNEYHIGGVPQSRSSDEIEIPYLWIGIAFLDMENLPEKQLINFNCGKIHGMGVDAGGYTYYYLHKYPELKINYFSAVHACFCSCQGCLEKRRQYPYTHKQENMERYELGSELIHSFSSGFENVEFYINGTFFHYGNGTNWTQRSPEYLERKTYLFNQFIEKILSH